MSRFLVVFDVDSTLIEDEVIELLAEAAGKRAEVKAITDSAMAGELDFTQSLAARVSMLAGVPESAITETLNRVKVTKGAVELIEAIHRAGGKVAAVSGGFIQVLEPLANTLGLDFYRANTLEVIDGQLSGKTTGQVVDRAVKAESLREWATELGLTSKQAIAVGDGANDLEMMAAAGLGVAFNAKPLVRATADLVIAGESLESLIAILPR
ncbi:MAG: phosphoserine phosphatase SerB [Rhodoluna sp.]|nr:phosphoserine phosphatase SerB [Rhodoluna sp.]